MAVKHVAFTMYPVSDMPRAVTFYRDGLGLKETNVKTDFWAEFDIDGQTLGIGNFEQVGKPGTARSLALEIDDLPAFRKQLESRGIESSEPHELQTCFISTVDDPDGNSVVLHQSKR